MSLYFDNNTDTCRAHLAAALTIGVTGVNTCGWFCKRATGQGGTVWLLGDALNPTSDQRLGLWSNSADELMYTYLGFGGTGINGFGPPALNTNYGYVVSKADGTHVRLRVFADDAALTKLYDDTEVVTSANLTTLDELMLGIRDGGGVGSPTGELLNWKLQTTTEWTDAECRTELSTWLIQKSGGTDRHALRLCNLGDSTAGLHSCASTALFVNSGCVAGTMAAPVAMEYAPLASDDFNRANENPIASPWSAIAGGFTGVSVISGNNLEGNGTDGPVMHATTMPNDHWSEIIMRTGGGGLDIGPMVRCSTGKGYLWALNATGDILYSTAGSFVNSGVSRARNAVDEYVFRLEAVGGVLRCYENGVQVGADVSDSNVPTGTQAGAFSFNASSNVGSWAGGRFGVPVTGPPVLPFVKLLIKAAP